MTTITTSNRPDFYRQRSNSAPTFAAIDCSADEAVIICTAAARASDRRRGRRKEHRYASLDVETERSTSRHDEQLALIDEDSEMEDSSASQDKLDRRKKIASLETYATSMAKFIHERIDALQSANDSVDQDEHTSRCPSPPAMTLPDDQLCPSPPPEDDEDTARVMSVIETYRPREQSGYLRPEDFPQFHPPLQSQFSAWSSATSVGYDADPTTNSKLTSIRDSHDQPGFFNSFSDISINTDDKNSHRQASFIEDRGVPDSPADPAIETTQPHPSISLARSDSHHSQHSITNAQQPIKHVFHLSLDKNDPTKPKLLAEPRPAFTTPQTHKLASYFPSLSPGLKANQILDAMSPFDGAAITKIHRIFVQSPGHLLVEGQMFEMCRS